jgi:predicted nucleotidyltransferase
MIGLSKLKPKIEDVCKTMPVKCLDVFGSALTKEFRPGSDVDILVVFDTDENIDLFDAHFEVKERLEAVFRRGVDLTVDKPFKNPIFRDAVERTRIAVYER